MHDSYPPRSGGTSAILFDRLLTSTLKSDVLLAPTLELTVN